MIVIKLFLYSAHYERYKQVKYIIEYSCYEQRHNVSLCCGYLLCKGKYLGVCKCKRKGSILYKCYYLVRHRRQYVFDHLGEYYLSEGLSPAIAEHACRLTLSYGYCLYSCTEYLCKVCCIVQ